jgi:hypothetical protein
VNAAVTVIVAAVKSTSYSDWDSCVINKEAASRVKLATITKTARHQVKHSVSDKTQTFACWRAKDTVILERRVW